MNEYLPLRKVYAEIDDAKMEVQSASFKSTVALCRPDGLLAIDYSKIESDEQEKAILLEEIGHFQTYAFYPPGSPHDVWEKQEQKAIRFVFEKYYPPELLAGILAGGNAEYWEVAEALGLPQKFVKEMFVYYSEIRNINFDDMVGKQQALKPEQEEPKPKTAQRRKNAWIKKAEFVVLPNGTKYEVPDGMTAQDVFMLFETWCERMIDNEERRSGLQPPDNNPVPNFG